MRKARKIVYIITKLSDFTVYFESVMSGKQKLRPRTRTEFHSKRRENATLLGGRARGEDPQSALLYQVS